MLQNWARNLTYSAARIHRPTSVDEVAQIVASATKVRALGSRHSFNDLADTLGDLISMEHFDQILQINAERRTATIQGGITYGDLAPKLHEAGFALPNLASLPHISVAGAVATATHGSGIRNGNLATSVSGLKILTASGDILTFDRDSEDFNGAVVSLGALGIVLELTLDLVPTFDVAQTVYQSLPFDAITGSFEEVISLGYSVSLFTNWDVVDVWVKQTRDQTPPNDILGTKPAGAPCHPLAGLPTENCTPQLGEYGAWHERLPHFRMEFTPSNGEELQSEFFVPRSRAVEALQAVRALKSQNQPLLHVSEIRTIAKDDLWLSPAYGQDVVGIHFTWKHLPQEVKGVLPILQEALSAFGAKPHWGKLFEGKPNYEMANFRDLATRMDPNGKFRNAAVERALA